MQKYPHKCPKNKKMPWYFVWHNEIPRFYALNFNQYPKSVVYPKSVIRACGISEFLEEWILFVF